MTKRIISLLLVCLMLAACLTASAVGYGSDYGVPGYCYDHD